MPEILISTLYPIRQRPAGPYLCLSTVFAKIEAGCLHGGRLLVQRHWMVLFVTFFFAGWYGTRTRTSTRRTFSYGTSRCSAWPVRVQYCTVLYEYRPVQMVFL